MLAHLGNGAGDDNRPDLQVRAIQSAKHGNLWVDTSSGRSILPGLIEWGLKELGVDRLLFGSDTPLYHVAMQRTRIECAEISATDRRRILRDNAIRFFRLDKLPASGRFKV
jgi:predicted TIM-barrel fold metal-dependent hydrolase